MQILVYGGSGSGKSAFAESMMQGLPASQEKFYIATMQPAGDEAKQRIKRHQMQRAGKGFTTLEQYTGLHALNLPAGCAVLLECLGNVVANEMFSPDGAGQDTRTAVLAGLAAIRQKATHLVIVSNDVTRDGVAYPSETQQYQQVLAQLNRELVAASDVAIEMVCGIPVYLKGGA